MPRFPFNLKPMLAIMMFLMVAGNVCAQTTQATTSDHPEPLQYYRVFVPAGKPNLWPMQGQRYIPVPQDDFQKLLNAANQTIFKNPFSSPEVKITSADYEMTLKTDASEKSEAHFLTGHAHLQAVAAATNATKATFLTLGPAAGMNLQNPVWAEGKQPIPIGTDSQGHLVAKLDRSGSFEFDLMSKNRSTKPGELRFELTLPRSTRSAVALSLDPRWNVSVTSGLLLDRTAKADTKKIRWTVAPTLEGQLHLLLVKKKDATTSPEIPDVRESLVYEFSPRGLELRSVLRLASPGAMLPERLRLCLDKPLMLTSARLGSQPVKWSLESETKDHSIVSLEMPKSRPQKATLRLKAACPIVEDDDWQLPRIIPKKFFWLSGDITLLVTSPLSIGKLVPLGCIRTKTGELPDHQGRSFKLTSFQSDATATISLGWERHLPTLNTGTVAELSVVGTTVTQNLVFTASPEDCFELEATVKPGWVIDSLESTPSSMVADWRVTSPQKSSSHEKLMIRLTSALSKKHSVLRLKLSARRLQSPLGKKLSMQDLTPVTFNAVQRDRCLTAITTMDPYAVTYRNEEFADSVSLEEVEVGPNTLFSRLPAGKIFMDNPRSARLEILLEEQKPVYAATIETVLKLSKKKLVEQYRFRCDPEASRITRLLIHLSGETANRIWLGNEARNLHFLPAPEKPDPEQSALRPSRSGTTGTSGSDEEAAAILSPKSFTAVKLTPADQASVGMSSKGETWEIILKTPQNKPFELHAVRTCNIHGELPVTIHPNLAIMPKAVEHHATLQVETSDAASVWIDNRRLEPITITPTTPLKIQKLRAAFRYETTDALASTSASPLRLTVGSPKRTSLLAWKCIVQTEYGGDGIVKGNARYELENRGESRLRLRMPRKASPLTIIDVSLNGQHVGWTPEYLTKNGSDGTSSNDNGSDGTSSNDNGSNGTSSDSKTPDLSRRLLAINLDLPDTKRFVPVTINYTYRTDSLGITQDRTLLAPEPDCDVINVDWRFLLPPGYEAPNYVAIDNLPNGELLYRFVKPSSNLAIETDRSEVLSPRTAFCWRTCLFGPLGRPFATTPFNPLSSESWSKISTLFGHKAWATSLENTTNKEGQGLASAEPATVQTKDHPDWKRYHLHYSSFGNTPSVQIVHRDSLEIFRWMTFLMTLAAATWARSARWIRRLPVAIAAALLTILLPTSASVLASGFFMGVLIALLAIWLLENGTGRDRFRRLSTSNGSGMFLSTTASVKHAHSVTIGSTATSPATMFRPKGSNVHEEKQIIIPESGSETKIELGKPIDDLDKTAPSTPKPQEKPPRTADGSTSIHRHPPMLWFLAASLLITGSTGKVALADVTVANKTVQTQSATIATSAADPITATTEPNALQQGTSNSVARTQSSPTRWPILVPTVEKTEAVEEQDTALEEQSETTTPVEPMLYLPEPFFRTLEKLAGRQTDTRDLWLLQNASLRVVLEQHDETGAVQPAHLFLTLQSSCFSKNAEIRLPLKQEEVQLKTDQVVLDGRTVSARWSTDGTSLLIPVAGQGPHQLELTLVPSSTSATQRWNAETQRDEAGFQVQLPCCPRTKIELTYPLNLPQPTVDHLLHVAQNNNAVQGVLASENRLTVWWPEKIQETQTETPAELAELLLLDVTPKVVTLDAMWSMATDTASNASPENSSTEKTLANHTNRVANRLRDITLLVDPRLRLLELTDGFTLKPIENTSEKRRLSWNLTSDPPKQVHAKFVLEKTGGIGQFHTPTLQVDQSRVARHWLGVRVAPTLKYEVHFSDDKLPRSDLPSATKPKGQTPNAPKSDSITVLPETFMDAWQEKLTATGKSAENGTITLESASNAAEPPSFVVTDRQANWSFHTEPKSIDTTVLHQTLRASFGETAATIRFDAEWLSGSCDTPEPTLRVPQNFHVQSASLIDDGIRQSIPWSSSQKGFIHLATGILPAKRRTIRVEGTIEPLDATRTVPLPVISLVGAEKIPVYLGIYRKPDALLSLAWKQKPIASTPPSHIANGWLQGQLVHWIKHTPTPENQPAARVKIRPNRPTIRARQVVTIVNSKPAAKTTTSADPSTAKAVTDEMVASFELAPRGGVIDEIAIFVPNSVIGPFRTEPILPLVRSHETDKGRTIVFRPKEPIEKWQQFQLSSPMEAGETRIPDVKLCGADNLTRYVILPDKNAQGERQHWQMRLLNHENDPATLGTLMALNEDVKLYRVVGRQWLAIASDIEETKQMPTVALADIQVRWQEDGAYLASAVFNLDPAGNDSCRLLLPEGLTLLDARIAGIPISPTKVSPQKAKQPKTASKNAKASDTPDTTTYQIHFTSPTLPQRIEVLYRKAEKAASGRTWPRLGRTACRTFQTPFLDVETQKTRWTVQGPLSYTVRGKFDTLAEGETLFTPLDGTSGDAVIPALTPYLTEHISLGIPIRKTFGGLQKEWTTAWRSQMRSSLAEQMPSILVLLTIGILALIRPVRMVFSPILQRHRPFFGIGVGLFWWLFLSPSILGWAIIIAFLLVVYRTRSSRQEDDSTVVRIG